VTAIEEVFREHWGRVVAGLIGFLGDFDVAEEAAQEAFAIAAERWRSERTAARGRPAPGRSPAPARRPRGRVVPRRLGLLRRGCRSGTVLCDVRVEDRRGSVSAELKERS